MYAYGNQAYEGLTYSFKYFLFTPNVGAFVPGACFMYPTTKTDMRMYMTAVRPRDAYNFLDFGLQITAVEPFSEDPDNIIVVTLSQFFGAPIAFFEEEVVSNRFRADGTEKESGYSSYTIVGVGAGGQIQPPSFFPIYNQLFLAVDADRSWTTFEDFTLGVPAAFNPNVGEYLATEMRYGCSCPDYLARQNFNLYSETLKGKYPITNYLNVTPGTYDTGTYPDGQNPPRLLQSKDDPGYVRDFGVIYLNRIIDIPNGSEASYSAATTLFFQPRWCKHIYASMWEMRSRFDQVDLTTAWLAQPNDEPLNEYYREKFDKDLSKQMDFMYRVKNLEWWQKYSPARDDMPAHMVYPDMFNMMQKTLNVGGSGIFDLPLASGNFVMSDFDEYNPFVPIPPQDRPVYDGGVYINGNLSGIAPPFVFDGGSYLNGTLVPPPQFPQLIQGGTY